jgi:putative transposase
VVHRDGSVAPFHFSCHISKNEGGVDMPRKARDKSQSGVYHIIFRGANKQEIFHDDEDNLRFIETLEKYKKVSDMKVYTWCLMGNHVHLLLGQGKEELSLTMKRIGVSYAWYYNCKYKSTGHLFQDRYRSEKVETDGYLMTVVRYIHQNPVKAGLAKNNSSWKWSSCQEYYSKKTYPEGLLDCELVLGMFSENKEAAIKKFIEYNELSTEIECLDENMQRKITDGEAKIEIFKAIPTIELANVKCLPKAQRDEIITKIKTIQGISQRQIARILGVAPNLILRTKSG